MRGRGTSTHASLRYERIRQISRRTRWPTANLARSGPKTLPLPSRCDWVVRHVCRFVPLSRKFFKRVATPAEEKYCRNVARPSITEPDPLHKSKPDDSPFYLSLFQTGERPTRVETIELGKCVPEGKETTDSRERTLFADAIDLPRCVFVAQGVHKVSLQLRTFITKANEETDKWKLL